MFINIYLSGLYRIKAKTCGEAKIGGSKQKPVGRQKLSINIS
jgi:hypothetical protein